VTTCPSPLVSQMEPVLTAPRPLAPLPSKFAHEFVSTAAGVQALASTLAQCQVIGLDAEAFLTPAGTENVALLQFSTGQSFFIVDMLVCSCELFLGGNTADG